MPKRPSFQFYPGDWQRDSGLRSCSLGARGLWIEMLCIMHDGEPYGHLKVGRDDIHGDVLARMVGITLDQCESYLEELERRCVFQRNGSGTIFSRRMVRDERLRLVRAKGGIKSLENPNVPRPRTTIKLPNHLPTAPPIATPLPSPNGVSLRPSPAFAVASSSACLVPPPTPAQAGVGEEPEQTTKGEDVQPDGETLHFEMDVIAWMEKTWRENPRTRKRPWQKPKWPDGIRRREQEVAAEAFRSLWVRHLDGHPEPGLREFLKAAREAPNGGASPGETIAERDLRELKEALGE